MTIDDILMNNVDKHTQHFQEDGVPWCGTRGKDFVLLCALIRAYSKHIVVDLTIGISMLPCSIEILLSFFKYNTF